MSNPFAATAHHDFHDKVVVITGATKGLGLEMARGFAQAGARVVVSSRHQDSCDTVAAELRALGAQSIGVACHVGDWDQCEHLVDTAQRHYGAIDVLINNAGIAPVAPSLSAVTPELFEKTIAVNLRGPLRLTALAAAHMPHGGAVLNISSKAAIAPSPLTVVYAAAKAGLHALTQAAAKEFGPQGIRVNCIVCGTFDTPSLRKSALSDDVKASLVEQISLRRIADAGEIVGTALYLTSPAASYVNGALLVVDGG